MGGIAALQHPGQAKGLIPRNFRTHPQGYHAAAKPFPSELIIPESEWESRLKVLKDAGAQLADVRNRAVNGRRMPVLNQGQKGYCWAHSTTRAVMLARAAAHQPYVPLSAYAVACIIKNYRDEGGWCSLSLDFAASVGIPSQDYWPQGSMARTNDNAEMRGNAALHKAQEWWDFPEDRDKARAVLVSALLLNMPCATDFNWWGHSVCTHTLISVKPLVTEIDNSWGPDWEDEGSGKLEGDKAIPDGALALPVVTASEV